MKNRIIKGGVLIVGCLAVSLSSCSNTSEKSKSNYVIQEIITDTPNSKLAEDVIQQNTERKPKPITPEIEQREETVLPEIDSKEVLEKLGSVANPSQQEIVDQKTAELINSMPARSIVKIYSVSAATLSKCFFSEEISPAVFERMENRSFDEGSVTEINDLRYVRVLHVGFDGEIYIGELVVNQLIADEIVEIFKELFDARYPIEQIVLVDDFDADDNKSMEANNTSCFNYRFVEGTTKLSNHAYGMAIDINPLYNPYIREVDGETVIVPENGVEYADRMLECEYYIQKNDVLYHAFIKRGFTWGGEWESSKDYQHFQKTVH